MDSHAQCSQDAGLDRAIWKTLLLHAYLGGKTSISVRKTLQLLTDSLSPDSSYTGALLRPSEGSEHLRHACPWRKAEGSIEHILLLFKNCDRLSKALPEAYDQWLRECSRKDAQSKHDAVHHRPPLEDVVSLAAVHPAQSLRGAVLALLTEAPPQLAEDLASVYVAW